MQQQLLQEKFLNCQKLLLKLLLNQYYQALHSSLHCQSRLLFINWNSVLHCWILHFINLQKYSIIKLISHTICHFNCHINHSNYFELHSQYLLWYILILNLTHWNQKQFVIVYCHHHLLGKVQQLFQQLKYLNFLLLLWWFLFLSLFKNQQLQV